MNRKIGVVSLGCPKNLVDSEVMMGILKDAGYEITNNQEDAETIIINTCGFIESAKQESINTILEMCEMKEKNCKKVIVTGCLAQRYKDEIIKEIPEVDAVLGVSNYEEIISAINSNYKNDKFISCSLNNDLRYLDNSRVFTVNRGYEYLKIAEGCDNFCTYCIIPKIRGKYKSRDFDQLIKEAKYLASNGVKEIILVAQDTTRYGIDIYGHKRLKDLIKEISKIKEIKQIRLLYCYPEEIDDDLIDEIATNEKVCKYLDLPIQHSSDKILKMMGRRGTLEQIKNLIDKLRDKVEGLVLRTSLIVGFPGETQDDFENLMNFVSEVKFDRLGVFIYSKEENTPAEKLKPQIKLKTKKERFNKLMELQSEIHIEKNNKRVNNIYETLVEGISDDGIFYYGRTYMEAPDIDNVLYFTSSEPIEIGSYVKVEILEVQNYDLIGAVKHEVELT